MALYYQINYTLTDVPADAALLPRAVPPREPAALQDRLHHPRRREGPGPLRRHLPGLGRQQHRLVGRGRDQVLHGRRHASSRRSAAPAPRTTSAARTTSRTRRRGSTRVFTTPYAGLPQVIRPDGAVPVAAALRPVPLAHHGSDPLRERPARDDPGARLARRTAATCRCRTTSPRSPSGTRRSRTRRSRSCRVETRWR